MNFMENLSDTLNDEKSITENGAMGYKTTGKKLLDLNFSVSSLRSMSENMIIRNFVDAFYENKMLAIKWLFFASDIRGGLGERRLFRICLKYLGENHPEIVKAVIPMIPEYSRWDNMLCLLDTSLRKDVTSLIDRQLSCDIENKDAKKPVSLLAKWLPSCNASSKETKRLAKMLIEDLHMTEKEYRKILSELRAYLNVVEVQMSAREWKNIDYSAVPSRANIIYNVAFLRNDEERRRDYLAKLQKGETKINAGVLYPHDIVHEYTNGSRSLCRAYDVALEEMWNGLPDYVQGIGNTICVADGSGSMTCHIGNTNVSALDVANALAIYFSERSGGEFKDKYITFSEKPKFVDFSRATSLRQKIEIALRHSEIANTNIEAVFDLILKTAVNNNMNQEDLPTNILILSDMEFDSCVGCGYGSNYWNIKRPNKTLFDTIGRKYKDKGYQLPRLVFWNLNSRTGTIPVKENNLGVALISGFSPSIVKMVLSNSTDPFECLLEQINSERYNAIEEAVRNIIA